MKVDCDKKDAEGKAEIARQMLANGFDLNTIMKLTKLKEYEKSLQEYWESTGYFDGAAKEQNKIARNLKKMGLKPADIAQATGLTLSAIEKL